MPDVWDKLHDLVAPPPEDVYDPQEHRYRRNGVLVPGATDVLRMAGITDYGDIPKWILERAGAIGTAVHKATEMIDRGESLDPDSIDEAVAGHLLSYNRWLDTVPEIMFSEIEKWGVVELGRLPYGMIRDRVAEFNDSIWVLDIKTSSKKADWWPLQLAAYSNRMTRRAVVWTKKDGSPAKFIEYTDEGDYDVWEAALRVAHWRIRNGAKIREDRG